MSVQDTTSFPDRGPCLQCPGFVEGRGKKFRNRWVIEPLCERHAALAGRVHEVAINNRRQAAQPAQRQQAPPAHREQNDENICGYKGCNKPGKRSLRAADPTRYTSPFCEDHKRLTSVGTARIHDIDDVGNDLEERARSMFQETLTELNKLRRRANRLKREGHFSTREQYNSYRQSVNRKREDAQRTIDTLFNNAIQKAEEVVRRRLVMENKLKPRCRDGGHLNAARVAQRNLNDRTVLKAQSILPNIDRLINPQFDAVN